MSQTTLGDAIGVSYQQVQKYEGGVTPVTVERLEQICRVLGVGISDILSEKKVVGVADGEIEYKPRFKTILTDTISLDETRLLRIYRGIVDEKVKKGVLLQVKAIAGIEKRLKKR